MVVGPMWEAVPRIALATIEKCNSVRGWIHFVNGIKNPCCAAGTTTPPPSQRQADPVGHLRPPGGRLGRTSTFNNTIFNNELVTSWIPPCVLRRRRRSLSPCLQSLLRMRRPSSTQQARLEARTTVRGLLHARTRKTGRVFPPLISAVEKCFGAGCCAPSLSHTHKAHAYLFVPSPRRCSGRP
jgi:hypothetical protein